MDTYTLQSPEAGTYAEIYLPKRAEYQGALYNALTVGFNPTAVIDYLHVNRPRIEDFISPAKEFYEVDFAGDLPDYFTDMYGGYSMYEVDGVFRPKTVGAAPIQERTQVIRIMFPLKLEKVLGKEIAEDKFESANLASRAYLRSHHWKRELFAKDYRAVGATDLSEDEMDIVLRSVEKWARLVGLFLFGYVVRQISQIAKEEEIWVAFFWNVIVARVVAAAV